MRFESVVVTAGLGLCMVVASATPTPAQTLFQSLFGLGNDAQRLPHVMRPQGGTYLPTHRFVPRRSHRSQAPVPSAFDQPDEEIGPPDSGGPYRTMCVRTCDGFYFPIRHDAQQRNFAPDLNSCRSSCGGEAKLFYFPENGGSVDTMVDLGGHKYAELAHDFAYRKKLMEGCTCKAAPWSAEAAALTTGRSATKRRCRRLAPTRQPAVETALPSRKVPRLRRV